MPFDAAPAQAAVPAFRFHVRPPRIVWTDDDEAVLSALEREWGGPRSPIAPEDDDTSDRWDDDGGHNTPPRRSAARGLRVVETAAALNIPRAAFVALCEHHGILALRAHGGQQRRFVTPKARRSGLGRNVSPRQTDRERRSSFAVFHPDRLDDLARLLDWWSIAWATARLVSREDRRAFLLAEHAYLPDTAIADLSGYARSAVQKARAAAMSVVPRKRPARSQTTSPRGVSPAAPSVSPPLRQIGRGAVPNHE